MSKNIELVERVVRSIVVRLIRIAKYVRLLQHPFRFMRFCKSDAEGRERILDGFSDLHGLEPDTKTKKERRQD